MKGFGSSNADRNLFPLLALCVAAVLSFIAFAPEARRADRMTGGTPRAVVRP